MQGSCLIFHGVVSMVAMVNGSLGGRLEKPQPSSAQMAVTNTESMILNISKCVKTITAVRRACSPVSIMTGSLRSLPFAIVVLHVQHTRMHLLFVSASYSISVITIQLKRMHDVATGTKCYGFTHTLIDSFIHSLTHSISPSLPSLTLLYTNRETGNQNKYHTPPCSNTVQTLCMQRTLQQRHCIVYYQSKLRQILKV